MKQTSEIKDCKEDLGCFINSIEKGKLSKSMFTTTVDIFGIKQTSMSYMEIKSCENDDCLFFISYINASAEYPAGTPQQTIDASKQVYETLKGKNGTCTFEKEKLISMLNAWKEGNFSTEDFSVANCTGSYFGWSEISLNENNVTNPNVLVLGNNQNCRENWQCSSWSICTNSQQTRNCTDSNNCGTINNKLPTTQTCTSANQNPTCTDSDGGKVYSIKGITSGPDWFQNEQITIADECSVYPTNQLTEYYCDSDGKVRAEEYSCPNGCSDGKCLPSCSWTCYDNWSPCSGGIQTRTCTATGEGCESKIENRSCTSLSGPVSVSWSSENNQSYSDPKVNINGIDYTPYYSSCSKWCTLVSGKSYSGCESSMNSGVKGERVRWDGSNWQMVSATDPYSNYITVFNCKN